MLKNYESPKVLVQDFTALDILTTSVGKQNENEGGAQGDFFAFN